MPHLLRTALSFRRHDEPVCIDGTIDSATKRYQPGRRALLVSSRVMQCVGASLLAIFAVARVELSRASSPPRVATIFAPDQYCRSASIICSLTTAITITGIYTVSRPSEQTRERFFQPQAHEQVRIACRLVRLGEIRGAQHAGGSRLPHDRQPPPRLGGAGRRRHTR